MRNHLNYILFPLRSNRNSINQLFSEADIKKWRTHFFTYPVSPETKEVHLKILNNIYPSNELLRRRFGIDHNNCSFCDTEIESTDHLFFDCLYTMTFWEDLQDWLSTKIQLLNPLTRENIVFGINIKDNKSELVLNNLLLLAKFFIHTSKWRKTKPLFHVFKKDLVDNHLSALKIMKGKNGLTLLRAYEVLKIFEDP